MPEGLADMSITKRLDEVPQGIPPRDAGAQELREHDLGRPGYRRTRTRFPVYLAAGEDAHDIIQPIVLLAHDPFDRADFDRR